MTLLKRLVAVPWLMLLAAGLLVMAGALALYSASEGSWAPWAERHLMRAALGFCLVLIIASIPLRFLYNMSYLGLLAAIAVLAILQIVGIGTGATRWIVIAGFNFQPSEPAKIAVVIALARYLSEIPNDRLDHIVSYVPAIVMLAVPFLLVLVQPDLGTSLMLLIAGATVIVSAGLPKRWVFGSLLAVLASAPIVWAQLYDYQKARIFTFLNPGSDEQGAGYQIIQSKIALGSGGIFGKGFLMGSQSQLNYLPEKQTDFVFTMIGEEFGLVGNLVIIAVYFIILLSINMIALRSQMKFGRLVCIGISMVLFSYVFVNIGMVTGLLPVVGAPLPLISYGGTAMLSMFVAFGVVVNIAMHTKYERIEQL